MNIAEFTTVELLDLLEQLIREEADGPLPNSVRRVRGEAGGD